MPSNSRARLAKPVEVNLSDAVVWVDSPPPRVLRRYSGHYRDVRIVQRERQFSPHVTVVAAGTAVRFVNRDQVYHNVFSISPAKRFDIGKYRPRDTRRVVFDRTGLVNLFCDIHPDVAAYVFVVAHRVFTKPNAAGQFVLPPLPTGRYRVGAWHPLLGKTTQDVVVPRYGDVRVRVAL